MKSMDELQAISSASIFAGYDCEKGQIHCMADGGYPTLIQLMNRAIALVAEEAEKTTDEVYISLLADNHSVLLDDINQMEEMREAKRRKRRKSAKAEM